jgi:hypothetical protein
MTLHLSQIFLTLGRTFMTIPQSKLGDDLPAIPVVTGGTNLNAISYDEPAEPMPGDGIQSCGDPTPVRETYGIECIREHFLHCSGRICLTRRENTSKKNLQEKAYFPMTARSLSVTSLGLPTPSTRRSKPAFR